MNYPADSAAAQGLVTCSRCAQTFAQEQGRCTLCNRRLNLRKPNSVQATWAYLITAMLCYLPANMLPIMLTEQLGRTNANTILGGVVVLWEMGAYPTALVIFVASVLIPIAKIIVLGWLAIIVTRHETIAAHSHDMLFRIVETIGSWSMVDVFVVALLVALVRFTGILSIAPGPAALAFCGMVIFTILAAHAFDPRLIWDRAEP